MDNKIEILDVTLRDGEQTRGVVFTAEEKLNIASFLLERVKVPRVEVTSARVSEGELRSVQNIIHWAKENGFQDKIELLGFVDHTLTVDWLVECGALNLNLLTKGSLKHLSGQLRKTLPEHLSDIEKTVSYAKSKGITVNAYLEDWSNGYMNSREYVYDILKGMQEMPIKRIYLADTLGVLAPYEIYDAVSDILDRYPNLQLEFHGHNDYDLSVANALYAIKAGVKGIHVSVNGLGERAGNTPLEATITAIHDKLGIQTGIKESEITALSKLVEVFSGKRVSDNRPIVGQDVFTQTAGVHADGDLKGNLYANPILPERFGRRRSYALGKLAGKASITENLMQLGITLSKELEKKVLERVIQMGDAGLTVTEEDLPFLIADVSGEKQNNDFKIESCVVSAGVGVVPSAGLKVRYKDVIYKEVGKGDGGYDAFMNALSIVMNKIGIKLPYLVDYQVRIPPGGKTSALVETLITWDKEPDKPGDTTFKTIG
ncbi:MAG: 2-isopropylmalate synthase, partial [Leptospiraceae bacterium]|nr:2-isopropylmalate synthase [Leptospiraceae bacterium]